jgi:hypothetical protein
MPLDPLSSLSSPRQRLDALYVPTGLSSPGGGERARPFRHRLRSTPGRAAGEGMVVLRAALVGLAIALAGFELPVPAAIAFVTALAVPRLWRARG